MKNSSGVMIMIIGDTRESIRIIGTIRTRTGCQVSVAITGEKDLDRISIIPTDMILLDSVMRVIDWFKTWRRFKEEKPVQSIRIIFLSALVGIFDTIKGFDPRMTDYLIMHITPEEPLTRGRPIPEWGRGNR